MRKLERDIETSCVRSVACRPYWVRKFTAPGRRNVPDRIFMSPSGLVFWIEFKRPGEKLRPAQEYEIKLMRDRGGIVYVCDNIEHFKRILTNHP